MLDGVKHDGTALAHASSNCLLEAEAGQGVHARGCEVDWQGTYSIHKHPQVVLSYICIKLWMITFIYVTWIIEIKIDVFVITINGSIIMIMHKIYDFNDVAMS